MNVLWPVLISVSYIYAILNGKILELNNSIFQAVNDVLKIIFVLVGNTCLWCGLMNIIKNTKLSNFLIIILRPFINWIFQKEKDNKEVLEQISINIVLARELTKIHEEFIRGTISEVLEKVNPKGEFIIMLEGEKIEKENQLNNLTLEEHYTFYERQGLDKKEIIKKIAKDRNVNKNEIYQKFI